MDLTSSLSVNDGSFNASRSSLTPAEVVWPLPQDHLSGSQWAAVEAHLRLASHHHRRYARQVGYEERDIQHMRNEHSQVSEDG